MLEIIIKPFIFPRVVDGQIDLIIDFPAPSIVIHRSQVDVPAVSEVHLGVQESLLCLKHVDAFHDESLKEHIVEDFPENWLVALSRSEDTGYDPPICCVSHGFVKLYHGVVIRLNNLYLLLCPLHHIQHALLYLSLLIQRVVVQQFVFVGWVKLRIGIELAQTTKQGLILIFCVQTEAVLVGSIYEMLAILVKSYIFSQIVEVLVLVAAISDACIAALYIGRPD